MKTEKEIKEMIFKLMSYASALPWWEESKEYIFCVIDGLLWTIGDNTGRNINPETWENNRNEK